MKKVLRNGLLLFIMLMLVSPSVYAASRSSSATLYPSDTTATTSRVSTVTKVQYNVVNTGNYGITYRVFKNGTAVTNYIYVSPGNSSGDILSPTQNAEYSLRMYCSSPSGTGCQAGAGIIGS